MQSLRVKLGNFLPNFSTAGMSSVLYGLVACLLLLLLLSFGGSAIVYFSTLAESWLSIFAVIINVLALFIGGFIAGRKGKNRGLLRGGTVALLLLILIILTGNASLVQIGSKLAYYLPAGALGGICGVK